MEAFEVIVEDAAGREQRSMLRVASCGRPFVGEWLHLKGQRYEVVRVVHRHGRAPVPQVFARHVGTAPPRRHLDSTPDEEAPGVRVVPFTLLPRGRSGRLSDLESFVLGVVIAGYLEQIRYLSDFRRRLQPEVGSPWVADLNMLLGERLCEAQIAYEAARCYAEDWWAVGLT